MKGAQHIIAEQVSEDEHSRNSVRSAFRREAFIVSKVVKAKRDSDEAQKYSDYFDWEEPLKRCSSHRLLAMRRGQEEGILRVSITIEDDDAIARLQRHYVRGHNACSKLVAEAVEDGYKRLLLPSIETEYAAQSKERADEEAINVFAQNLRQLLLSAPLGQNASWASTQVSVQAVRLSAWTNKVTCYTMKPSSPTLLLIIVCKHPFISSR